MQNRTAGKHANTIITAGDDNAGAADFIFIETRNAPKRSDGAPGRLTNTDKAKINKQPIVNKDHKQPIKTVPPIISKHPIVNKQTPKVVNKESVKVVNRGNKEQVQSKVIRIRNVEDYDAFKKNNKRCVVFYSAEWCHACKSIGTLYTRIANRYYKRVAMAYVDIDEAKLDFTAVPVFVTLFNGKEMKNIEGSDEEGLKSIIKEVIKAE